MHVPCLNFKDFVLLFQTVLTFCYDFNASYVFYCHFICVHVTVSMLCYMSEFIFTGLHT